MSIAVRHMAISFQEMRGHLSILQILNKHLDVLDGDKFILIAVIQLDFGLDLPKIVAWRVFRAVPFKVKTEVKLIE